MGLNSKGGKRDDVNNKVYDSAIISINNGDPETLLLTPSAHEGRQWIYIKNLGPGKISVGPQGRPKDQLSKNEFKYYNHGFELDIYAEVTGGTSADVYIEESG